MVNKFTEKEYAKHIPKKHVGGGVLLFNGKGEILIVKPDYRDDWLIPGGVSEADESPVQCVIRETKEEVGLDIKTMRLVCVYYGHKKGFYTDSFKFIFHGGTLSEEQIASIVLQTEELDEYQFMLPENAIPLLSATLQKILPACIDAIKNNTVAYIENSKL